MSNRRSRPTTTSLMVLGVGAMLVATLALPLAAAAQKGKKKSISHSRQVKKPASKGHTTTTSADNEKEPPAIDVLTGIRTGQLAAAAEGRSDGRITLSLKNRTDSKL